MNQELVSKIRDYKRNGYDEPHITQQLSERYAASDIAAVLAQLRYMQPAQTKSSKQLDDDQQVSRESAEDTQGGLDFVACLKILLSGAVLGFVTVVFIGWAVSLLINLVVATSLLFLLIAPIAVPLAFIACWKLASVLVGVISRRIGVYIGPWTLFAASFTAFFVARAAMTLLPLSERVTFIAPTLYVPTAIASGAIILLLYVMLMHTQTSKIAGYALLIMFSAAAFGLSSVAADRDTKNFSKKLAPNFAVYDVPNVTTSWSSLDFCTIARHRQSLNCKVQETETINGTTTKDWHSIQEFVYSSELEPFLPRKGSCNLYALQDIGRHEVAKRQAYINTTLRTSAGNKTHAADSDRCRLIGDTPLSSVYTSTWGKTGNPQGWMYARYDKTIIVLDYDSYNNLPHQDKSVLALYGALQRTPAKLYTPH